MWLCFLLLHQKQWFHPLLSLSWKHAPPSLKPWYQRRAKAKSLNSNPPTKPLQHLVFIDPHIPPPCSALWLVQARCSSRGGGGGSGVGWRDSWVGWRGESLLFRRKGGTGPREALRRPQRKPQPRHRRVHCHDGAADAKGNHRKNRNEEENRMSSLWTVWQM